MFVWCIKVLSSERILEFMDLYTQLVNKFGTMKDRTNILSILAILESDDLWNKTETVIFGTTENLDDRKRDQEELIEFFTAEDREWILGKNAEKIYFKERPN